MKPENREKRMFFVETKNQRIFSIEREQLQPIAFNQEKSFCFFFFRKRRFFLLKSPSPAYDDPGSPGARAP
jgi:hypothetical protein